MQIVRNENDNWGKVTFIAIKNQFALRIKKADIQCVNRPIISSWIRSSCNSILSVLLSPLIIVYLTFYNNIYIKMLAFIYIVKKDTKKMQISYFAGKIQHRISGRENAKRDSAINTVAYT